MSYDYMGACAACGERFDAESWDVRHSDADGEDVHEECCEECSEEWSSWEIAMGLDN